MKRIKEKAEKLKTDIPAIFLALKDPRTPISAKILAAIIVIYALSPIDLIPDFIPFFGYLDDIILLPTLITLCIRRIPKEVLTELRQRSATMWAGGKPEKWYYAVPFVLIWCFLIFLILCLFL